MIITPHCSSVYEGWEQQLEIEMFCDNLDRWKRGRDPGQYRRSRTGLLREAALFSLSVIPAEGAEIQGE